MADISCCGCICSDCKDYGKACAGCNAVQGKVYWAGYLGLEACPIYTCSVDKNGLKSCGQCAKLPCEIYYQCVDPSMSPEQHEQSVRERVRILSKAEE
jgi:hypothetical protein